MQQQGFVFKNIVFSFVGQSKPSYEKLVIEEKEKIKTILFSMDCFRYQGKVTISHNQYNLAHKTLPHDHILIKKEIYFSEDY